MQFSPWFKYTGLSCNSWANNTYHFSENKSHMFCLWSNRWVIFLGTFTCHTQSCNLFLYRTGIFHRFDFSRSVVKFYLCANLDVWSSCICKEWPLSYKCYGPMAFSYRSWPLLDLDSFVCLCSSVSSLIIGHNFHAFSAWEC